MIIEKVEELTGKKWAELEEIMPIEHAIEDDDLLLVCRKRDGIRGYLKRNKAGHIHALFVSNHFNRQGIGIRLLSNCCEISKSQNLKALSAGANAGNNQGINFFVKNGFRQKPTGNNHVMFTKTI